MESYLNRVEKFDPHTEPSSVGQRWSKWVKTFETFITAAGITNDLRKKAILLNLAGEEVSETFDNLPDAGITYAEALGALNKHYTPEKNVQYEIFVFRSARQEPAESIIEYYSRLRKLAATCEFTEIDKELKTQLIIGTNSEPLRKKGLKESKITLKDLLEAARTDEIVEAQARAFKQNGEQKAEAVNKIGNRGQSSSQNTKCRSCGGTFPHSNGRKSCPAYGRKCYNCSKMNHFAELCNSNPQPKQEKNKENEGQRKKKKKIKNIRSRQDNLESSDSEVDEVVFAVRKHNEENLPTVEARLGKSNIEFQIDTGSSANIISQQTYENLKEKIPLEESSVKLFPYQSKQHLPVRGTITTPIRHGDMETLAKIYVITGQGESIISYKTAKQLKLIELTYKVSERYNHYTNRFQKLFKGIGKLQDCKVRLHVDKKVQPVAQQHRRVPFHLRAVVQKEIERLEEADIIERVDGPTPWVSPIVIVPKPHDPEAIRLCVDMRSANKAIKRVRHPTPTIDDIITTVNGATWFTKLDLNEGYHQLEIEEESRSITTFSTHLGLRRYKRLNFGINSAAEIFQDTIRQVLVNIPQVMNISDDILVFGTTKAQHDEALEAVLERLQSSGLTVNKNKCTFAARKLSFFGFEFSEKGMRPDPKKVKMFLEMPEPQNVSEVRSILGMINYCGRFIPNLSTLTQPLRALTVKESKWEWGEKQTQAFETLKKELSNSKDRANVYFDTTKPTHLIVDAGPEGLGAILSQPNKESPGIIACASRSLSDTEKRYSQIEKEMLAITWAVEHFKIYLFGSEFKILSDHKPLINIINNTNSKTSTRLERLLLRLQGYSFNIEHTPGASNPSDFLSRHPEPYRAIHNEEDLDIIVNRITDTSIPIAITRDMVAQETNKDECLQKLKTAIYATSNDTLWKQPELKPYAQIKYELAVTSDGIIIRGNRIVIPKTIQEQVINLAHKGHQGITKTKRLLRDKVWFPNIDSLVEKKVGKCIPCQATTKKSTREPIQSTPLPQYPWQKLSLDFLGPLPNKKYIMVIIDDYSRFPIINIIRSTSSEEVNQTLNRVFTLFGIPEEIKSDNGPPFNSEKFSVYWKNRGCHHRKITPLWPEANGTAERFMKTLEKTIRTAIIERRQWETEVEELLQNYRATPHSTTLKSPASTMFANRPFRIGIPEIYIKTYINEEVERADHTNKRLAKDYADSKRHTEPHNLNVGDAVLVKQPIMNKYSSTYDPIPSTITHIEGSMITAEREGKQITRNSSHFKKLPEEMIHPPRAETPGDVETPSDPARTPEAAPHDQTQTTSRGPDQQPPTPGRDSRTTTRRTTRQPVKLKDYYVNYEYDN